MKTGFAESLLRHYTAKAKANTSLWNELLQLQSTDVKDERVVRQWGKRLRAELGLPLTDPQLERIISWLKQHPVSEEQWSVWKEQIKKP